MFPISRKEWAWVFILSTAYIFFWLISQQNRDLDTQDLFWYLNRGQLFWRGDFTHFQIYNIVHPILTGLLATWIQPIILSAVVVNGFVGGFILLAVYWLGVYYYNRPIAVIAMLILATHPYFLSLIRQLQPMPMFVMGLLWYIILTHFFIKSPSYRLALAMGLLNTLLFFTRGEGLFYGILIVVGCLAYLYKTLNLRTTIGYFFTATIPMGLGFLLYNLLIRAGGFVLTREDLLTQLSTRQTDFAFITKEFNADTALLLSFWGVFWLVVAWVWIYAPRYRPSSWIFFGLILFHMSIVFVAMRSVIVGSALYYLPVLVFSSFLLGWAVWEMSQAFKWRWVLAGLVSAILIVNLRATLESEPPTLAFAFLQDTYAQDARVTDEWLKANELQNQKVYTLCYNLIGYAQAPQQYMYRSAYVVNLPNQWDSPENLLPRLYAEDALFMSCESVFALEWQRFLQGGMRSGAYRLELIGVPTQNYRFYRVLRED
jgi:hypothetical protein